MLRRICTTKSLTLLLGVVVIFQLGLLLAVWHHQRGVNNQNASTLKTLQQNIASAGNGSSYQQVTVSPSEQRIYLPQIGIYLPLTTLGTSLVYSPDTAYVKGSYEAPAGPYDEAAISTFATAGAQQTQSQFDCSELVRIKYEAKPDPYNPNEQPAGSVSLANGKTLQIYADHLKNCQKEWAFTGADADAVAALFKQAHSY